MHLELSANAKALFDSLVMAAQGQSLEERIREKYKRLKVKLE